MNIAPGTIYLQTLRAANHPWMVMLGELIDNAFDAGASRIELDFPGKKKFIARDDGNGCENIEKMLTLGEHTSTKHTKLGMHGVGLKDAATTLWGKLTIDTVHNGMRRLANINWDYLVARDDWNLPDPSCDPTSDRNGTTLSFDNIQKDYHKDPAWLADEIGFYFMPALLSGKQIVLRFPKREPIVCKAYAMPQLTHVVEDTIESPCGKQITIRAGVVAENHVNRRKGFAYVYGHRVIMDGSLGSCGNSTARIAGVVQLIKGWKPSKNKTELVADQQDILEKMVYDRCVGLFELAKSQSSAIEGAAFNSHLNSMLNDALSIIAGSKNKREARPGDSGNEGTVEPKNSGRKRTKAASIKNEHGSIACEAAGKLKHGARIEWYTDTRDDSFGKVDLRGGEISLNDSHPKLSHLRTTQNEEAILLVALGLFTDAVMSNKMREKITLFKICDGFVDAWAAASNAAQYSMKVAEPQA